jgi:hypothetical protein
MGKSETGTPSANFYTDLYNLYAGEETPAKKRLVYPVDLTDLSDDLKVITERLGVSKAGAIREAVKNYAEHVRGLEVVTYRNLTRREAKKEIQRYLKDKERVWTDEISDALRIDLSLVNEVLLELWEEGWVEPRR